MLIPFQPNRSYSLLNLKHFLRSTHDNIHVAFVDPFASVKSLSHRLRDEGIETSAIYTLVDAPSDYTSLRPDLFDHVYYVSAHKDLNNLADLLKQMKVNYLYYGSEMSVHAADLLANILTPEHANSISSSHARSDLFAMHASLHRDGIRCVKQMKVEKSLSMTQQNELQNWRFPVMCKSINNINADDYILCYSLDNVKSFLRNQSEFNVLGQLSHYHVIQEYDCGAEYFVDMFSVGGDHFVSGVQRCVRALFHGKPVNLYSDVIGLDSPEAKSCVAYVKKVLDSVGLKNGFSHTDVNLSDKGPCLVQLNPRISGASGLNNKLYSLCGLTSQLDLLVSSIKQTPLQLTSKRLYGRKIYLQNYKERRLNALNVALLYTLPSFRDSTMLKSPGNMIAGPQTVSDTVGYVLLAHSSQSQVEMDYQQLMYWQNNLDLF